MEGIDKEYIARRIANLNHVEHMKNAIPDSITFLQMYQVKDVNQLNIVQRWQKMKHLRRWRCPSVCVGKMTF